MRRDKWYLFTLLLLSTCLCLNASVDSLHTSELSQKFLKHSPWDVKSASQWQNTSCVWGTLKDRETRVITSSAAWFPDRHMLKTTQRLCVWCLSVPGPSHPHLVLFRPEPARLGSSIQGPAHRNTYIQFHPTSWECVRSQREKLLSMCGGGKPESQKMLSVRFWLILSQF